MDNCVFCRIVRGDIPAKKAYEDDSVLAFHDANPASPVHILVVPKKHMESVLSIEDGDRDILVSIMRVITKLALDTGIAEGGFRVVANTGPDAGQSVPHLHFHLLGGRHLSWPPG